MTEPRCNNAGKVIKLLAEVESPFSADHALADYSQSPARSDALIELVRLLASRNGIHQVLRRYESQTYVTRTAEGYVLEAHGGISQPDERGEMRCDCR
jgi:hypothetical protein